MGDRSYADFMVRTCDTKQVLEAAAGVHPDETTVDAEVSILEFHQCSGGGWELAESLKSLGVPFINYTGECTGSYPESLIVFDGTKCVAMDAHDGHPCLTAVHGVVPNDKIIEDFKRNLEFFHATLKMIEGK